ncbi:MAG: AMP-binding protein, partial [Gammaproteobacteria bacterium]|nr:AMP-binding protein [Gammaproteobacteria bacterium]
GQQLPPGKSGEIRVRGEGMPDGYYREPAAGNAPARFRDGWFYPGDIGHVTADGLVFVEGRSDDIVNLGGHKFALPLIDCGIESHPEVRTAVAFTIEDTDGSVMVGAGIERRPAATPTSLAGIAAWSRKTLNLPVAIRLFDVTGLTRDDMGKIDRKALRTQVLEDAL